ncbi:hypothetical protein LCGC14_1835910 [marine sediment metagenome]|uniref:Uncharacterized protein n=1 Tax=marine sediment metagenome TaxID=412755 RepID=A0A0F9GER4_9ZZZZ
MPIKVKYDSDEAKHIARLADTLADKLIAGESLRLALPIARLVYEKVTASYKRIEKRHGGVV